MKRDIEAMIGNITTDFNYTDIREYLPTLLDIFCPGENVCKDNDSRNISFDPETQSTKHCCSACLCSDDCEMSNKCCFPKSGDNTSQERRIDSCYSTLYPDDGYNEQAGYKSYMMIDREIIDDVSESFTNSSSACGDMEVVPWGTIYPVYSPTSKQIYKNHACAEAYGIEDYIKWRVYADCSLPELIFQVFMYSGFKRIRLGRKCEVRFEFPGDKKLLEDNICYKKLDDTCPETFNTVTTVSDKLLQAACYSGPVSTYRGKNGINFKNAFCSICNNQYFDDQECFEDNITRKKYAYSVLFDTNTIINVGQLDIETTAQHACHHTDSDEVRLSQSKIIE
ncbi:hypothetical protein ACF0H5_021053 [Mactra antiquata]